MCVCRSVSPSLSLIDETDAYAQVLAGHVRRVSLSLSSECLFLSHIVISFSLVNDMDAYAQVLAGYVAMSAECRDDFLAAPG